MSELASGVAFAAAVLVAPVPAFAGADWSACLHAADPNARAAACTDIIENTRERKILLRALNARGNALCATADRCRDAVPDFTSVVKLAPDVAGYHDNLARALRAATRYQEALQESDRAIGLAPKLAFVYVGKARILVAAGRGPEALDIIQAAMAMVPVDAGLLEYQGKLLGDLKRYPESYVAFERALQKQPTRVSIYARRADIELADGRTADAIRDLERYPIDGTEADQVRGKLDVLRARLLGKGDVADSVSTVKKPAAAPSLAKMSPFDRTDRAARLWNDCLSNRNLKEDEIAFLSEEETSSDIDGSRRATGALECQDKHDQEAGRQTPRIKAMEERREKELQAMPPACRQSLEQEEVHDRSEYWKKTGKAMDLLQAGIHEGGCVLLKEQASSNESLRAGFAQCYEAAENNASLTKLSASALAKAGRYQNVRAELVEALLQQNCSP